MSQVCYWLLFGILISAPWGHWDASEIGQLTRWGICLDLCWWCCAFHRNEARLWLQSWVGEGELIFSSCGINLIDHIWHQSGKREYLGWESRNAFQDFFSFLYLLVMMSIFSPQLSYSSNKCLSSITLKKEKQQQKKPTRTKKRFSVTHSIVLRITFVTYFLMVTISKPMEMTLEEAFNLVMKWVQQAQKREDQLEAAYFSFLVSCFFSYFCYLPLLIAGQRWEI